MKVKAIYLGIPCLYDNEQHKLFADDKIGSILLNIAIRVDNLVSFVYFKVSGKRRQGTILTFSFYPLPWSLAAIWIFVLLLHLLFANVLTLLLSLLLYFILIYRIWKYLH